VLYGMPAVCYKAAASARMSADRTVAVWPWLLTMLIFLVLVTYWPAMSLFLPKALGMMR
jgi:C4-dicarboxylate transporter, DctM subunit